jgi:hypothetical protein
MAELTTKQRNDLPDSDFVFPEERKYPINDESHARNALARVAQHGTPAEQKKVREAVTKRYPGIEVSGLSDSQRNMARAVLGKK